MGSHSVLSRWRGYQAAGLALLVLAAIAVGCTGENLVEPDTGTLEIGSATTGVELDTDGYTVQIDGGPARPLGPNATVQIPEVASGTHTVLLAGAAANCAVEGNNPRSISITGGHGDPSNGARQDLWEAMGADDGVALFKILA